ncbi:Transmembrane_domain-containing protein [Hexamita inflata]|uniref:Transmembrane domain-containing protein n=1 Tax=Hexamita inflata TaxID=28002 RepID=A0AA86TE29_9EUKA|nr:Transmembrane domain-containing protein [Hexamita inflata]
MNSDQMPNMPQIPNMNMLPPTEVPQQVPVVVVQPVIQPAVYQQVQPVQMQTQQAPNPVVQFIQTQSAVTVVAAGQQQELSFLQIFVGCQAPQFEQMQQLCGCCTCWFAGAGLCCGSLCGCYGSGRSGCIEVGVAGLAMDLTAYLVYGWVVACIVGLKMMMQ